MNIVFTFILNIVLFFSLIFAQKDYGVHDPSTIVKENNRYYTFYTSNGVEYAYSSDLCTWQRGGKIFTSGFPSWITSYVPGFEGHFWAPDVFYMNNLWHVYYSCSSFGSRQSAIGLATTASLSNPQWQDKGVVVSTNNSSDHNAIDPAIIRHDGKIWLAYGSFWSGIVITELDSTTGKPVNKNNLHYIANGDPEAASIIHHGDYYYLFFNRGKCCNGVNSTYYINVGRSLSPNGPYLDKSGKSTSSGGGTVILKSQGRFIGPGHFGFFSENGREYISYHYYDANQNGASKLKINSLSWQDDWPVVNTDFNPCNQINLTDCAGVKNGSAYIDNCGVCAGGTTDKKPCQQDCHGDWGGAAFVDSCGICAAGKTGLLPCNGSFQFEDALEFDGVIETTHTGFIGKGYLNLTNEKGSAVTISLCSDINDEMLLVFRYANGGLASRMVSVSINNSVQIDSIIFTPGMSWMDWKSVSVRVRLQEGKNLIKLTSLSSDGGPNLDLVSFSDKYLYDCSVKVGKKQKATLKNINLSYSGSKITFYMSEESNINYQLLDLSGRIVMHAVSRRVKAGINHLVLNNSAACQGLYLIIIEENSTRMRHEKLIAVWR